MLAPAGAGAGPNAKPGKGLEPSQRYATLQDRDFGVMIGIAAAGPARRRDLSFALSNSKSTTFDYIDYIDYNAIKEAT